MVRVTGFFGASDGLDDPPPEGYALGLDPCFEPPPEQAVNARARTSIAAKP